MNVSIEITTPDLAEKLLGIYAPYVVDTAITFEYEVPTIEAFRQRICRTLERYPYLVAFMGDEPVGYAYAGPFKSRAAYDWAVETSVYVRQDLKGQGIGKSLYQTLEAYLVRQGVENVNACITYPNPASVAFHEALGYRQTALFSKCGYKLGRWHDMIWMEKHLGNHEVPPKPFIPFGALNS